MNISNFTIGTWVETGSAVSWYTYITIHFTFCSINLDHFDVQKFYSQFLKGALKYANAISHAQKRWRK